VLQNLIGNALTHAPNSRIRVRVDATAEAATVSVEDEGPGIPADQLPLLFDRFYRGAGSGAGGLGLGLYISRMLVEAHGGEIWAESGVGKGSSFHVRLPWRPLHAPPATDPLA
jgi:signal transduction histidine kinase